MHNLAENKDYQQIKNELAGLMIAELKNQKDPRMFGNGVIFDKYEYSDGRTRNFYNRYIKGELNKKSAGWIDSTDFEDSDDIL